MKIADLKITVDSSGEDELVRNPSSSSVLMQCLGADDLPLTFDHHVLHFQLQILRILHPPSVLAVHPQGLLKFCFSKEAPARRCKCGGWLGFPAEPQLLPALVLGDRD